MDTVCSFQRPAECEPHLIVIILQGFRIFDNIPFRLGLPESATSGLEKFEG
jgi:hypothetical protein